MRRIIDQHIEGLRVLATLSVVLLHVTSICILYFCEPNTIASLLCACINDCCRFAVPVFVMITGFLLLKPEKIITYKDVIKKYSWRIVVILFTIGLLYAWLEIIFVERQINFIQLCASILNVLQGNLWDHMWYLYMLIGVYLVIPVLKAFIKESSTRELDILLTILGVFGIIVPCFAVIDNFKFAFDIPIAGFFVFYLLLGYRLSLIDKQKQIKYNKYCLLGIFMCILVIFLINIKGWRSLFQISYGAPIIVIMSFLIFNCRFKDSGRKIKFIEPLKNLISNFSFGIYLFHPLWINLLTKVMHFNPMEWGVVSVVLFYFVIILLSIVTTWCYRKIPLIGKYI